MLDGIQLNGMCGNGSTQAYTNTQSYEEMVFQTTSAGADVSAGGIRQNMVPRQGGNDFHGSFNAYGSASNWQAGEHHAGSDRAWTHEGRQARRVVRRRRRRRRQDRPGQGVVVCRGAQDQREHGRRRHVLSGRQPGHQRSVRGECVRSGLTAQLSPRATRSRATSIASASTWATTCWPATIRSRRRVSGSRRSCISSCRRKWTSTVSNRLLLDAGYGEYRAQRHTTYQPGVEPPYGSPAWFAAAYHQDTSLGTVTNAAPGGDYYLIPVRRFFSSSVSYVSGAHTMKFGAQDTWGFLEQGTVLNAALGQIYQNGCAIYGGDLQHAGAGSVHHERAVGTLCAGCVDAEASDDQLRPALGVLPLVDRGRGALDGGTLRAGSDLRTGGHADLEDVVAAARNRVRPARQRQDRAQVQRQQVPALGDQRRGGRAQPDAAAVGVGHLEGSERRRYRRGSRWAARSAPPGAS